MTFAMSLFVLDSKFTPPEVVLSGSDVDNAHALSQTATGGQDETLAALSDGCATVSGDLLIWLIPVVKTSGALDRARSWLFGASSLPRDLALITEARRGPAPTTGAGTARKLDLVRGVVALDNEDARLTEFRRTLLSGIGFTVAELLSSSGAGGDATSSRTTSPGRL